jgi:3-hydroxyacyl-CoA dehydrogenase
VSDDPGVSTWAAHLESEYLDQGKLGGESGEGFYDYW